MWTRASLLLVSSAVAAIGLGCTQPPATPAMVVEDKLYSVSPEVVTVNAGIMTGVVTEMRIVERVEKGSGNIITAAKLSGKLVLKNRSNDQTVRLVGGTFQFVDAQGQLIKMEEKRTEPTLKFTSYGSGDRLDPGQETSQSVDVDFPADALKTKRLKEIRLDLAFIPSPYKAETLNFGVSIASPAASQ